MGEFEDAIARTVISAFTALPPKSKPRPRPNATEWVPLSGIVLETSGEIVCVALGWVNSLSLADMALEVYLRCFTKESTGMKCLPHSKIALAAGMVLHDCHAEVIVARAFNCFITAECLKLAENTSSTSKFVRRRGTQEISEESPQPFTIQDNVKLHFYSSEAPCGDGSMELTMSSQDDATPWTMPCTPPSTALLRGRGYFSELGVVRTKPGRVDSPPTLSKSCSDKLALRQVVSILLSPVSALVTPEKAYITSIVLNKHGYSETACRRAFGPDGRMAAVKGQDWGSGYAFRPFRIETTDVDFTFSKREAERKTEGVVVGSNVSAVWVQNRGVETLIGGVLQGRKQFSGIKGASMLSKMRIWKTVSEVAGLAGLQAVVRAVNVETYGKLKEGRILTSRNRAKVETRKALGNWVRNGGDDFSTIE